MKPKKILLFEDNETWYRLTIHILREAGYEVECVTTLPASHSDKNTEFQALRARGSEFAAIVWDCFMPPHLTHGYVQAFKKDFKGPMIAFSENRNMNESLCQAGCTHSLKSMNGVEIKSAIELRDLIKKLVQ